MWFRFWCRRAVAVAVLIAVVGVGGADVRGDDAAKAAEAEARAKDAAEEARARKAAIEAALRYAVQFLHEELYGQEAAQRQAADAPAKGAPAPAGEVKPKAESAAAGPSTKPSNATTAPASAVPPETLAKIEAAIKEFSSDSWKERQEAQDKLVSFGEDAVEVLRRVVDKTNDEEVRTRAGAALRKIEENSRVGASLITLNVTNAKPQDVFAEIARQARCEITPQQKNMWSSRNFPAVSMNVERANFWTALKEACAKSGVSPVTWGHNQRGMQLTPHGGNVQWNGPTAFSGPFMVVANRVYKSSSIDLANPLNVQREFSINLMAFAEPKLRVLQSYNVKVDEAVDDRGNDLRNNERNYDGLNSGNQWAWNLTARLAWPERPGTRLQRFKGSVRFIVQTRSETLDVPDITKVKNLARTVGGRRILIKELKQNGSQYELNVTTYRDGLTQNDWNMMDSPYYMVRLTDKDGRQLNPNGMGSGGGPTERSYQWTFTRETFGPDNEKVGEPYRLVWEVPLETQDVRAEFDFKDLPLPN